MEIMFKDEERKQKWESFKETYSNDDFGKKIILFTESLLLNLQNLLGDNADEIVNEENWYEREKRVLNAHYDTFKDYQIATQNEILYESQFAKIINQALINSGSKTLSANELKCVYLYISSFWKYGERFKFEIHRKEHAKELRENLQRINCVKK